MRAHAWFLAMIVLLASCQKKRSEPGDPSAEDQATVAAGAASDQAAADPGPAPPENAPPLNVGAATISAGAPAQGEAPEGPDPNQPPPAFVTGNPDPKAGSIAYVPEPEGLYGNQRSTDGKTLYLSTCAPCHAPDGSGDFARAKLPELGDLRDPAVHRRRDDAEMKTLIRRGHGTLPPNDALSDEQVDAIVSFVRTLKR